MPDYTSIHTGPVIDQGVSDGLTAVQPADLATVATSGDYTDLINIPATFVPSAHNHIATDITDFIEAVQDAVNGVLVAGTNITLTYNDVANTLTIAASGGGGAAEEGVTLYRYFNDFLSVTTNDMSNQSAGTGASVAIAAWPFGGNPPASGFVNGALGTTATGRAGWMSVSAIALHPRVGEILFKTRQTLRTLSDAVTATYTMDIGMMDTPSGVLANGMYFRYTHSVNGGRWQAVCRGASVETAVDTGVTAVTNAMATFEIRGNAAGTEYTFYIDGVLVATINTNLPAIGTGLGWGLRAIRTVGTAATNAWLADYVLLEQTFPSRI